MAVNAPNPSLFLQQVSDAVVGLRDNFETIVNKLNYINAMGGAAFLEAAAPNGLGLSPEDAAVVIAGLGNLVALNAVYNGGNQGAPLNYGANSQPLWGGR